METILANRELVLTVASLVIVWLIRLIWKKSADRAQIFAALATILDIVQDIANSGTSKGMSNTAKKDLAIAQVNALLPPKQKSLVTKVFGGVSAAVEFVYKNRKWLFSAAGKLVKAVF